MGTFFLFRMPDIDYIFDFLRGRWVCKWVGLMHSDNEYYQQSC